MGFRFYKNDSRMPDLVVTVIGYAKPIGGLIVPGAGLLAIGVRPG
jgi:hypothetical protein